MQHHVHAARQAPVRAHHISHMPLHPSMAPVLQQDPQHITGIATTAVTIGGTPQQPTQQQQPTREHHHARLNHHHHPPPGNVGATYHQHSTNQMQKIRQQHQHLNSNSGHAHSHTKCNPQQQQQQQPPNSQTYNHIAANAAPPPPPPLGYNQLPPPHHMAHMGGYAAQPQPVLGGKPPHYYVNNHKPSKYNNNTSSNNCHYNNANSISGGTNNNSSSYTHVPKAILQNTYRQNAKINGQSGPAATAEVAVTVEQPVGNSNNIVINTEASVVEQLAELPGVGEAAAGNGQTISQTDDDNSSTEHIDAVGDLPNEDSSAARNSKDKTPMCLVNELARYNKITHQYRLTEERGPAHCKTFTVTLKLGEEEYSADGFKIKKAQHLAASKAIEQTKYKHPPPKIRRSDENSNARTHITPTVELNALAMKLGQRTYYLLDPSQIPPSDAMLAPDYGAPLLPTPQNGLQPPPPLPPQHVPYAMRRQGNYVMPAPPIHPHVALQSQRAIYGHQRGYAPKYAPRYALPPQIGGHMMHGPHGPYAPLPTTPSKITLFVGKQKFVGIGRTLQQAKHDAAARALQVLKTQGNCTADEALDDSMDEGDKKSPISQVHEIGIKRNMTVHFKVLREEGPAHMKNFITACIVGSIVTEGEGNGKKISKKRAAEKMLAELQKLPPLTPTKQMPLKRIKVKTPGKTTATAAATPAANASATSVTSSGKGERRKRTSAPVKEKSAELDDAENPITKLIQLQQNRKEKEPIFELIAKNGNDASRRREFVMEVSANGSTARGTGNSKKLAKRNAAQALLEMLETEQGSSPETIQETNSNSSTCTNTAAAAVTTTTAAAIIMEPTATGLDVPMVSTPAGPVPGILILRQNKKQAAKKKEAAAVVKANVETKEEISKPVITAAEQTKPNELEATGESALNTSTGSNTSGVSSNSSNATTSNSGSDGTGVAGGVHMKEQLLYLSKLLDFEVNFSDYPKGSHNEFLTIVTLSTNPPQICHGVGKSSEESQNDAARNALKILSELGLNNAKK